jgi:hypothetical protein
MHLLRRPVLERGHSARDATSSMERRPRHRSMGSGSRVWFRYGFHHKKAIEQRAVVEQLVKQIFGPATELDLHLRDS